MRIALAPVVVHPGERSRNLASASAAVASAAEQDPPPDLIVLPGCCDTQPASHATDTLLTPAMCQGFAQSLAALAREWGCWLACGHTVFAHGEPAPGSSLFDPDGDTFIREPRLVPGDDESDGSFTVASGLAVESPIGTVIVAPGETAAKWPVPQVPGGEADLIVAMCSRPLELHARSALTRLAAAHGATLCITVPAANDAQAGSEILDSTGRTLARIEGRKPKPVAVDLPIRPGKVAALYTAKGVTRN